MTGNLEKNAREVASVLLRSKQRRVMAMGEAGGKVVPCSMNELLKPDGLPQILFEDSAPDREERAQAYGLGNEDIDVAFDALLVALRRVARFGRGDPEVLSDGEFILNALIRGVQDQEWEAKQSINPSEAAKDAYSSRLLRDLPLDPPISPNEIDAEQGQALFVYQSCKHARLALEDLSTAVRQINQTLRDEPGQGPRPPSR